MDVPVGGHGHMTWEKLGEMGKEPSRLNSVKGAIEDFHGIKEVGIQLLHSRNLGHGSNWAIHLALELEHITNHLRPRREQRSGSVPRLADSKDEQIPQGGMHGSIQEIRVLLVLPLSL